MEQTTEKIRLLLGRWYEARTTDDEERELREWFRMTDKLPIDLEPVRRMFSGMDDLALQTIRTRPLKQMHTIRRRVARCLAIGMAAAAIITGVVFTSLALWRPYGYINGQPVRDAQAAMQTMVYLEQLEAFDRSMQTLDIVIKPTEK